MAQALPIPPPWRAFGSSPVQSRYIARKNGTTFDVIRYAHSLRIYRKGLLRRPMCPPPPISEVLPSIWLPTYREPAPAPISSSITASPPPDPSNRRISHASTKDQ